MKYLNFGLSLLLFIIILFPFLVLPRLIKINKIICRSQYGFCSSEILGEIDFVKGQTLFNARLNLRNKYQNDKKVKTYAFYYQIPQTLKIDLVLKKAKYAWKKPLTDMFKLISIEGEEITEVPETNLPVLISSEFNLFGLELLYRLNYVYGTKIAEIKNEALYVDLPGGIKVLFPLEGDYDLLLGSLKLILSRLNDDEVKSKIGKVSTIDLRFKNPIIRQL